MSEKWNDEVDALVDDLEDGMEEYSNIENSTGGALSIEEAMHDVKHRLGVESRAFCRDCRAAKVPVFLAYYLPGQGYKYRAVLPEEIESEQVLSEYGKFKKFLQTVIGFNKADYFNHINKND